MSPDMFTWAIGGLIVVIFLWGKYAPIKGCTEIDGEELSNQLDKQKDIKILDVRTESEYQQGHIPGAMCRPLGELEKWAGEYKRDQSLYLICASGSRSKAAARKLAKKGFGNLFNIKGGMVGWKGPVK